MATFAVHIGSGCLLFLDSGGASPLIHLYATWFAIGFVLLHVALHAATNGMDQLLRIVRPARLTIAPPGPDFAELLAEQLCRQSTTGANEPAGPGDRLRGRTSTTPGSTLYAHPLVSAVIAAIMFGAAAIGFENATRPALKLKRIVAQSAPQIDGDLSDPAWLRADPVSVVTTQGGDFGGSGQSTVEVRALHDGEFAYFAFVWTDPTRSLKHMPLVKMQTGWALVMTDKSRANEQRFHEDKFAVLISQSGFPLIGTAIHLSAAPLKGKPASATRRGLHYTPDGSIADVWVWRASHQGAHGHVDNCHIGKAVKPTAAQSAGRRRYAGGFAVDPLPAAHFANFEVRRMSDAGSRAEHEGTTPRRLPRDLAQTLQSLGRISDSPHQSESEGARWWLSESHSVPYTNELDARIPVGTVIPGVVMKNDPRADPSGLRGRARWASGRWSLEIVRRLRSDSRHDVSIVDGTLMWLAAFDHSQSRHTRHLRPFIMEIEQ